MNGGFLADCEDAIERVRLRAEKKTSLRIGVLKVTPGERLPVSSTVNVRVSCVPPGIRQRAIFWRRHNAPTVVSLVCIEFFSVVDVKTMRWQCKCNARTARMVVSRVSTARAIRGPQKCFPDLASCRQVDADSEIAFSKKDETFQRSQGILSPLRLPVPPRPLWSGDQILSAFSGEVE